MDERGSLHSYVPSKELPKEVLELPPDETRCRFCGVSYLVHHEVSKLKEAIKDLQIKLTKAEKLLETRSEPNAEEIDTNLQKELEYLNTRYILY